MAHTEESLPLSRSPLRLFLSYADADERWAEALDDHLAAMKRGGILASCSRRKLVVGESECEQLRQRLEESDIVLVLVSPKYLASDDCYVNEMQRALALHQSGTVRMIPVCLRPVALAGSLLDGLACLPSGGRPVSLWRDRDSALVDIANGIRRAAMEVAKNPRVSSQAEADRRAERNSRRMVARSRAIATAQGTATVEVYLTSELFQQTLPLTVALDSPSSGLLDKVIAAMKLPVSLDHGTRVSVHFKYRLVHEGNYLVPEISLQEQGVLAGGVLWLESEISVVAPIAPTSGSVPYARFRDPEEREQDARTAALARLRKALRAADINSVPFDEPQLDTGFR